MNKLDQIVRHHAEQARRTVECVEIPPTPNEERHRDRPVVWPIVAAVAAIVVIVVPLGFGLVRSGEREASTTDPTMGTVVTTSPTQTEPEQQNDEQAQARDGVMCESAAARIKASEEFLGIARDAGFPLTVPAYLADGSRESVACHRESYPYALEVTRRDPSSRTFLTPPDATVRDVADAVGLEDDEIHKVDVGVFSTIPPPEDDPSGSRTLPIEALVAEKTITSGVGIDPEAPDPTPSNGGDPDHPGILLINDVGVEAWAVWGGDIGYYFLDMSTSFTSTETVGQDNQQDELGFWANFGFNDSDEVTVYGVAPNNTNAVRMSFAGIPPIYVTRLYDRPEITARAFVGTIPLNWLVEAEEGSGLKLTAMRDGEDFTPESLTGHGLSMDAADTTSRDQVGDIFREIQPLVLDTTTVGSLPEVVACAGATEDIRRSGSADVGSHPTQEEALEAFINEVGNGPELMLTPEGWIKVTTDAGNHAFVLPFFPTDDPNAYQPIDEGVVVLVPLEETSDGWTVTEWESSGC